MTRCRSAAAAACCLDARRARSTHPAAPPLSATPGLDKCRELNTLVLSHNAVASLGSWASGLPKLEKLSLSYNALAELGPALK